MLVSGRVSQNKYNRLWTHMSCVQTWSLTASLPLKSKKKTPNGSRIVFQSHQFSGVSARCSTSEVWCFRDATVDGSEIRRSPPVIYEILWEMGYSPYQLVSRISSINSSIGQFGCWHFGDWSYTSLSQAGVLISIKLASKGINIWKTISHGWSTYPPLTQTPQQ